MAKVFFNENDPFAAAWLRKLYPEATVDERSIADLQPADLVGYTRCHFFGGIGGWEYALHLAGWPDDREVWTGSCPCQPFSAAGKQQGEKDSRHLWPEFRRLIAECLPATVFGEQVASALGREWLAGVRTDLEGMAYAVGAADLCAAGVGAPNIRQRLWWVADAEYTKRRSEPPLNAIAYGRNGSGGRRDARGLADAQHAIGRALYNHREDVRHGHDDGRAEAHGVAGACGEVRGVGHAGCAGDESRLGPAETFRAAGSIESEAQQRERGRTTPGDAGESCRLGDTDNAGSQGHGRPVTVDGAQGRQEPQRLPRSAIVWDRAHWLPCLDGKSRRAQPGIFPLVDGVSGGRVALGRAVQQAFAALSDEEAAHEFSRVGVLRGGGNAINPVCGAEFISAFLETEQP